MKSKDERQAEKAEKIARMNAKFDAFRAKMDAKSAALDEQMKADKAARQKAMASAGKPPTKLTLGGMLFPPLGAYQVVKMTAEQVQEMNAMTPEERLEFTRRNPGFGSGGG